MNLEIALALLAASAPTTAVILRFAPQRTRKADGNGDHFLTTREFDTFKVDMLSKFLDVRRDIADVRSAIGNS